MAGKPGTGRPVGRPRKHSSEARATTLWVLWSAFASYCVELLAKPDASAAHLGEVRRFLEDNNVKVDAKALADRAARNKGGGNTEAVPFPSVGLMIPMGGEH